MHMYKGRGYDYIDDAYAFGRDLLRLRDRTAEAAAKGDYVFAVRVLVKAIECAAVHAYDGGDDEESPIMDAVEEGFERLMELARSSDSDPAALHELGTRAFRSVDAQWAVDGDSWERGAWFPTLDAAAQAVFESFRAVDERFSPYKESSETSRIDRGELAPEEASDEMKEVLRLAEDTRQRTDGYFDVRFNGRFDPSGLVKGWAIWKAAQLLDGTGS